MHVQVLIMVLVFAGLNPKLPDFMLPKKKKAVVSACEPVEGTSTGGHTLQVVYFILVLYIHINRYVR